MPAHGVMFHHFHGPAGRRGAAEREPAHPEGQGSIDAATLDAIIDHVGRARILPAREFFGRALAGKLRDDDVCLTFDDTLRCQYDIALPVLEARGIEAFWFVYTSVVAHDAVPPAIDRLEVYRYFRTTSFPGVDAFYEAFFEAVSGTPDADRVRHALAGFDPSRYLPHSPFYSDADRRFRFVRDDVLGRGPYEAVMDGMIARAGLDVAALAPRLFMDAAALRALDAAGHVVGLHSHTHPTKLAGLPVEEQEREYTQNSDVLRSLLGAPPLAVSHPCNSYSPRTLRVLASLGVRLGFRADMSRAAASTLELPREDHANIVRALGMAGAREEAVLR